MPRHTIDLSALSSEEISRRKYLQKLFLQHLKKLPGRTKGAYKGWAWHFTRAECIPKNADPPKWYAAVYAFAHPDGREMEVFVPKPNAKNFNSMWLQVENQLMQLEAENMDFKNGTDPR